MERWCENDAEISPASTVGAVMDGVLDGTRAQKLPDRDT